MTIAVPLPTFRCARPLPQLWEAPVFEVGDRVVRRLGHMGELHGTVREIDPVRRQALVACLLFGREMTARCGIDDLDRLD